MLLLESNQGLRPALKLEHLHSEQHRKEVERIRRLHPHNIRFVAKRRDQTCAMYAFSLTDDPTYRALAGLCDVYAGREFMMWAIESRLQEIDEAQEACLVSYFSGTEWRHVGVMAPSGRVVSKWGTYPLYEHGFAEISEEYGGRVRFYARPSPAEALSLFIDFAHECGLSDDDIATARR